jgi:hypothetical protein
MQFLSLYFIAAVFIADVIVPADVAFCLLLSPSTASTGRQWRHDSAANQTHLRGVTSFPHLHRD